MKNKRISLTALSLMTGALLSMTGCADDTVASGASASEIDMPKVEATQAKSSENDAISVLIDKEIEITTDEVDEMADAVLEANRDQIPPQEIEAAKKDIRKNVIDQLTLQALLLRECDKAEVVVTDEERDALFTQMTGGEKTFEEVAAEMDMSVDKFRDIITKNMRIEKFLKSKTEALAEPTDADAKARFDEIVEANPEAVKTPPTVEASHILVSVDPEAEDAEAVDAAAKTKIEEARQKLIDGGDFAEIATAYSDCPSKANGGSLGQFGEGQMVKPFEEAAFAQEVGKVGPVVKTAFGYHVIRVDKKTEGGTLTFDDVKEDILNALAREKMSTFQRDFFTGLRQSAKIENLENPVLSEPVRAESPETPEWAQ